MKPATYYAYLCSAREELWGCLAGLPEEALGRPLTTGDRFRNVKDLLIHIAGAEDYWVHSVLRGAPMMLEPGWPHDWQHPKAEQYGLEWLLGYARAVQGATQDYLSGLDDAGLQRAVDLDLEPPARQTAETVLWHVMTHEVRHSAQVVLMLRLLGHTPPWLDYGRFAPRF